MIRNARVAVTALALPAALFAGNAGAACYDVAVIARPVDQVPSDADCGADCIMSSWPWFIDLDIDHVVEGELSARTVRTLSVQHTYFLEQPRSWMLRRNGAGGFNILHAEDGIVPTRCPADAAPADPYIRPGAGRTLDDLREEGISRHGHHPRDRGARQP